MPASAVPSAKTAVGRVGRRMIEALESRRLLVAIGSDQTLLGSISVANEIDEYTFDANAGDSLVAFVAETSTVAYDPAIQLIGPNAVSIISDLGEVGVDILVNPLPLTGTYTLRVSDSGANDTGSYAITIAHLPGAQSATDTDGGAITSGQRKTGTLGAGDLDVYTFSALGGESIIVNAGETGPGTSFEPNILIYDAAGTFVIQDYGDVGSDCVFTAPVDGTYYVVVKDLVNDNIGGGLDGDVETGPYSLNLAHVPGPQTDDTTDGGALASGPRMPGTITIGDLDIFSVTAIAGEALIFSAAETGGNTSFEPHMRIYGPTGEFLIEDYGDVGADIVLTASLDGTYYVVVKDLYNDNIGSGFDGDVESGAYALTMAHLPAAQTDDTTDGGILTSGPRKEAAIALGDLDVYAITSVAGANLILNLAETGTSAGFEPQMLVYGPGGALVAQDVGDVGADIFLTTATAGTYYVVVKDLINDNIGSGFDGGMAAGNYALTLARLPGAQTDDAADGGALTSGPRRQGTLPLGDLDVFTISASAGDNFVFSIAEIGGNTVFDPYMLVYGPDGTLLAQDLGDLAADIFLTAPTTGSYHVVVKDFYNDNIGGGLDADVDAGSYTFTMAHVPAAQTDDWIDGGTITSGQRKYGSIELGDLDVFTFFAAANSPVILSGGEIGVSGMEVEMQVYGPNGAFIIEDGGDVAADLSFTTSSTGTYYVVVRDFYNDNIGGGFDADVEFGDYALALVVLPGVQTDDRSDGGALANGQWRSGSIMNGDMDIWTISVDAGDSILGIVREIELSGFDGQVLLYSPRGELLDSSNGSTNYIVAVDNVAVTGTYYAVVKDIYNDNIGGGFDADVETGDYAITFAWTPGGQPIDADSGALVNNVPRSGSISVGDIDVYTFPVTAGQPFTLNVSETTTSNFEPSFRIYDSLGNLVTSQSALAAATFTQPSPAFSQTYTVFVFDDVGDDSGPYSIGLNSIGGDNFGPRLLGGAYLHDNVLPRVRIGFTENVSASFAPTDVTITNTDTAAVIPNGQLSIAYQAVDDLIMISFPGVTGGIPNGVLPDGNYRVTIQPGDLSDIAGNPPPAAIIFDFFVLAGDATRDAVVNIDDLYVFAQGYKKSGRLFSEGDFNYDGTVNELDLSTLALNWQQRPDGTIAAGAPMPSLLDLTQPAAPPPQRTIQPIRPVARPLRIAETINGPVLRVIG